MISRLRSALPISPCLRATCCFLRTGHLSVFNQDGDRLGYMKQEPGLGLASAEWLHHKKVADCVRDGVYEFLFCAPPLK